MIYKVINKEFHPQSMANSCWAASIANAINQKEDYVLSLLGNNNNLSKGRLLNIEKQLVQVLDKITFKCKIYSNLDWIHLQKIVNGDRVIVYYFNISGNNFSHFVNIYGYEENSLGKWLYIYDPKPDNEGTQYILNFENFYSVISSNEKNKGLFYFET